MTKEELYTYIEAYLAGELDAKARAEFEQQRQEDPEFAAEVALHERLQAEFQDIQKLELRGILDELGEEFSEQGEADSDDTPPTSGGKTPWTWITLGGILIVAISGLWYFSGSDDSAALSESVPPQEEPSAMVDTPATPEESLPGETEPAIPPPEETTEAPSSPRLRINPALEVLIGQSSAEDEFEFQLDTPAPDATFAQQDGQIAFTLSGILLTSEFTENERFLLQIYNSTPAAFEQRQPETQFALRFPEQEEEEDMEFAFGEKEEFPFSLPVEPLSLSLETGLYYYLIVQDSTGDIWYAGKFWVE